MKAEPKLRATWFHMPAIGAGPVAVGAPAAAPS